MMSLSLFLGLSMISWVAAQQTAECQSAVFTYMWDSPPFVFGPLWEFNLNYDPECTHNNWNHCKSRALTAFDDWEAGMDLDDDTGGGESYGERFCRIIEEQYSGPAYLGATFQPFEIYARFVGSNCTHGVTWDFLLAESQNTVLCCDPIFGYYDCFGGKK